MNKKEYTKPEFEVIESSSSSILAGSGEGSPTENIGRGPWWETEPDKDDDGYIWVD